MSQSSCVVAVAGDAAVCNDVVSGDGANNLAADFSRSPIPDESVEYFTGDPTFATAKSADLVTQSATATFSVSHVPYKFFKAVIAEWDAD